MLGGNHFYSTMLNRSLKLFEGLINARDFVAHFQACLVTSLNSALVASSNVLEPDRQVR
jgi:hypothetical protein